MLVSHPFFSQQLLLPFFFFELESCNAVQAGLELSQALCLQLLHAGLQVCIAMLAYCFTPQNKHLTVSHSTQPSLVASLSLAKHIDTEHSSQ